MKILDKDFVKKKFFFLKFLYKKFFNFFIFLNKFNLFSASKTLHPFIPNFLIKFRMKLINYLHKHSPVRSRLRRNNPNLKNYFDELDSKGVLVINNFLPRIKFQKLFNTLSQQLHESKIINSNDNTIYKIVENPKFDNYLLEDFRNKLITINKLLSYVEGYYISKKRFGPILQSTKEKSNSGGENCKPHVDCFQPSAKGFIYLNDVSEITNPFCYITESNIRNEKRSQIEVLGHRKKTNIKGSWRAKELEVNLKKPLKCIGKKGTLIIADVSGFHYRDPSNQNNSFRDILYFSGISTRDNPFLKLTQSYLKNIFN